MRNEWKSTISLLYQRMNDRVRKERPMENSEHQTREGWGERCFVESLFGRFKLLSDVKWVHGSEERSSIGLFEGGRISVLSETVRRDLGQCPERAFPRYFGRKLVQSSGLYSIEENVSYLPTYLYCFGSSIGHLMCNSWATTVAFSPDFEITMMPVSHFCLPWQVAQTSRYR